VGKWKIGTSRWGRQEILQAEQRFSNAGHGSRFGLIKKHMRFLAILQRMTRMTLKKFLLLPQIEESGTASDRLRYASMVISFL